jgi:hypothetical protein
MSSAHCCAFAGQSSARPFEGHSLPLGPLLSLSFSLSRTARLVLVPLISNPSPKEHAPMLFLFASRWIAESDSRDYGRRIRCFATAYSMQAHALSAAHHCEPTAPCPRGISNLQRRPNASQPPDAQRRSYSRHCPSAHLIPLPYHHPHRTAEFLAPSVAYVACLLRPFPAQI